MKRPLNRPFKTELSPHSAPVQGPPPICTARPGQQHCEYWVGKDHIRRCFYCCYHDPRQRRKETPHP